LFSIERPMKIQLILCLYIFPRLTEEQLFGKLGFSRGVLRNMLKNLINRKLAVRNRGRYELTRTGKKVAEFLIELTETAKEELWRS